MAENPGYDDFSFLQLLATYFTLTNPFLHFFRAYIGLLSQINSFTVEVLTNRNQSIDLLYKSMDLGPYERNLRHERVNGVYESTEV